MPQGPGTYGSRRGRPAKRKKLREEQITASIVNTYGIMAEGIITGLIKEHQKLLVKQLELLAEV